jgi:hypothetical protein
MTGPAPTSTRTRPDPSPDGPAHHKQEKEALP